MTTTPTDPIESFTVAEIVHVLSQALIELGRRHETTPEAILKRLSSLGDHRYWSGLGVQLRTDQVMRTMEGNMRQDFQQ